MNNIISKNLYPVIQLLRYIEMLSQFIILILLVLEKIIQDLILKCH